MPTKRQMLATIADAHIALDILDERAKHCWINAQYRRRTIAQLAGPYTDALTVLAFAMQVQADHAQPETPQ